MKKKRDFEKEKEKQIEKFMMEREKLRQRKEKIKEMRNTVKQKKYKAFLGQQIKETKNRKLNEEREAERQALVFKEEREEWEKDKENMEKEARERQKMYYQMLNEQVDEKNKKKKMKTHKQDDEAEILARILENDKQLELLNRHINA